MSSSAGKAGSMRLEAGVLTSNLGGAVLRDVPAGVTARKFGNTFDGLVLSVSTAQPTCRHEVRLGQLECTRFLAASRIKLWWMIPCWGSCGRNVPPETQFLLLELSDGGPYAVLLPLIDHDTFRCTLRPSGNKHGISLRMESGSADVQAAQWSDAMLVGVGDDPLQLVNDAVIAAASLSGGAPALQEKRIPASVDVFGWCTWDAFYHSVSAKGIVQGLSSLKAAGVPPRLLIIDDGWQLTVAEEDGQTAAAPQQQTVAPTEPKPAEDAAVEQSSTWGGFLIMKAVSAIEAFGDFAVQWPIGISFAQRVMRGPLRDAIRQHHLNVSEHAKRLSSVEANAKFSSLEADADVPWMSTAADLKSVVAQLKARFGLKFVFCWHAMHGYWSGVSPTLEPHKAVPITPEPTPGVLEIDPAILWNPQTLTGIGMVEDVAALHRDMHTYLEGCGVDGVKVDVQGTSGMFIGGPRASHQYHESLEASVAQSFPSNMMINCMAHSTENLYRTTASAVTRVSDDFYPRKPASHTVHLGVCAYNSLFIGPLLLPDWDMFHSQHPAATLHAAARAASGGPVYVSDAPDCHDGDLLARLVLPDGSVLRATRPALPTRDTLFCDVLRDRRTLLKVWNMNEVNGLLFVANVQGASWDRTRRCFITHDPASPTLQASVRPHDVAAFAGRSNQPSSVDDRFAVYSERTQRLTVVDATEQQQVELGPAQWDLLVIAPLQPIGDLWVAVIGLVNMLNAGGAVLAVSGGAATDRKGTAGLSASLRGAGRMLAYASSRPARVALDGADIAFEYQEGDGAVRFDVPASADLRAELRVEF